MTMSGKYYPNNWKAIQQAPDELFDTCSYEDFEAWKLQGWDLPSSISCIIRTEHKDSGKIKEYIYKTANGAKQRLIKIMDEGGYNVTVCDHGSIHFLQEEIIDDSID